MDPARLRTALREVEAECRRLMFLVDEVGGVAWGQLRLGEGSSGAIDQSDPTGNTAVASRQRYLRSALASSLPRVRDCAKDLQSVAQGLAKAYMRDGIDVAADERRVRRETGLGLIPPPAPKVELAPRVEAQRRRHERGEQGDALGVGSENR